MDTLPADISLKSELESEKSQFGVRGKISNVVYNLNAHQRSPGIHVVEL